MCFQFIDCVQFNDVEKLDRYKVKEKKKNFDEKIMKLIVGILLKLEGLFGLKL